MFSRLRPKATLRRWYCSGLVLAILLLQIATAAYACPLLLPSGPGGAARAAMTGMPCAETMRGGGRADGGAAESAMPDAAQPGLCAQHCQFGNTQQPADPTPAAVAPLPVLLPLFNVATAIVASGAAAAWAGHARQRDRAPPLRHSILHCCHRL